MRTWTIWLVAIVASLPFAFAWFALAANSVIRAPADERSLEVSIYRTAGFGLLMDADCDHALTRCSVYDDSGGGATYVMTRRNRSCWEARRIENFSYEVDPPLTLDGCVRLWQWSLLDVLI
ncbi:hypothetical protein OJ998_31100 [Solirubrobacter taibaiensis]|nr:hypothetical protein [Solirubrobacter taibaiensis]